jgi:hypothetical protein
VGFAHNSTRYTCIRIFPSLDEESFLVTFPSLDEVSFLVTFPSLDEVSFLVTFPSLDGRGLRGG